MLHCICLGLYLGLGTSTCSLLPKSACPKIPSTFEKYLDCSLRSIAFAQHRDDLGSPRSALRVSLRLACAQRMVFRISCYPGLCVRVGKHSHQGQTRIGCGPGLANNSKKTGSRYREREVG
ncbi:hypothetical protein BC834DRAFT_67422 [Gloeopeniophorella convolvens]|nr:hypothetical protein BC834DRAFT_67422 [Gloeopeniophorella convolvens]